MSKNPPGLIPLKDLISNRLTHLRPKTFETVLDLNKAWQQLVGVKIAQNTKVMFVKNNVLQIHVKSNTWACELNLLKDELLTKINGAGLLPNPVLDIKFLVKPL